jgi:hypothetical protein
VVARKRHHVTLNVQYTDCIVAVQIYLFYTHSCILQYVEPFNFITKVLLLTNLAALPQWTTCTNIKRKFVVHKLLSSAFFSLTNYNFKHIYGVMDVFEFPEDQGTFML